MNDSREHKSKSANQTLSIIEAKQYEIKNERIDLAKEIDSSIANTQLYIDLDFEYVLSEAYKKLNAVSFETTITVKNCTSMQAYEFTSKEKVGCLNFASAKNPGGGFLNGAKAQEESLTRASALYPTLLKFERGMYDYNRARSTYLYSDYMIFSPQVPFFKDDDEQLLAEPYCMDIVTSPAVNVGAIHNNRPNEFNQVETVMLKRIDKILALFLIHGTEELILGAWGCGVFRNEPKDIARYFATFLKPGGKYAHAFRKIIFAVYDTSKTHDNINAFEKEFNLNR